MTDISKATEIVKAIRNDLSDWYSGRGVDDVEVKRWYVPIFDMSGEPAQVKLVTVYEGMTETERSSRNANTETHTIQIALQYRFSGRPDIETTDILRYELEQIARRYLGQNREKDDVRFRCQELRYGSVNDPNITINQNAWFGVVEMTILGR